MFYWCYSFLFPRPVFLPSFIVLLYILSFLIFLCFLFYLPIFLTLIAFLAISLYSFTFYPPFFIFPFLLSLLTLLFLLFPSLHSTFFSHTHSLLVSSSSSLFSFSSSTASFSFSPSYTSSFLHFSPLRLPLLRPRKMMNMHNQTRRVNAAKPQQTPPKDSQEVRNCLSQIQLKVRHKTKTPGGTNVLLLGTVPLGLLASVSVKETYWKEWRWGCWVYWSMWRVLLEFESCITKFRFVG